MMKMRIDTSELARALFRVQGIAEKKNSKPILAHVLLRASRDGVLEVSATDLDVGLCSSYGAQVEREGFVAVHAKHLYDVVKTLPNESLQFEVKDNHWVELQAGSSRFRLVGMPGEEFPELPQHQGIALFEVPAQQLIQMIDRTLFCVSTDDNRYNLSGIFCEADGTHGFRMVATDGHRLAMAVSKFETPVSISQGVIVPRKGFQELRRVLSDSAEDIQTVSLGFSGSNGVLRTGSVTLSTRLVDGQFPDYRQVIPNGSDKQARIPRQAFVEALRRAALLAQGKSNGVRLEFGEARLELVAEDPEFGSVRETLDIEYKSEPLVVGFNARYLLDVLALIPEQGVRLELADDLSPAIVRPLEEEGFVAIVMPMRI